MSVIRPGFYCLRYYGVWLVGLAFWFFWSVLVFYLFATESHVVQTRQVAKDDFKFPVLPPNC